MFEHLIEIYQPKVTRKSAARVMVVVFVLGLALGARFMAFSYQHDWKTWNPFDEIMFWFWVLPACGVVWKYIPAILEKLPTGDDVAGTDAV